MDLRSVAAAVFSAGCASIAVTDEALVDRTAFALGLAKGDFKIAAANFRIAVDIEPDNVALLNNLAWALSELNDPGALGYAERAYRLAPGVAEVANTYGWILVQRGDAVQGVELLRRAVELAARQCAGAARTARRAGYGERAGVRAGRPAVTLRG